MKKIIVFALLLIIAACAFSQQTNPSPALTRQDYLQKSKYQKKTAWILLGGGALLSISGYMVLISDETYEQAIRNLDVTGPLVGYVFFYAGNAAMLGSIPLFIASSRNKKKAMRLSFNMETTPQIHKKTLVSSPLPSLTLKIGL